MENPGVKLVNLPNSDSSARYKIAFNRKILFGVSNSRKPRQYNTYDDNGESELRYKYVTIKIVYVVVITIRKLTLSTLDKRVDTDVITKDIT